MTDPKRELVQRASAILEDAQRILVFTGAGVSSESGVPTFRNEGGLWRSYRPEELATLEAFQRDPVLVWEWYQWRRGLIAECRPNPGHHALARLALRRDGITLATQNVDGLHHRAGREEAVALGLIDAEPGFPLEVHGAIHRDRCSGCGRRSEACTELDSGPPGCTDCGAPLRPDVVWFGESLDPRVIGAAQEAALRADVCLVVGTSALVYPAAGLPEITRQSEGVVIEVNLQPTPLTASATISLKGPSGELLPMIVGS